MIKSISEQMAMFGRHDSSDRVLAYVKAGDKLFPLAEVQMLGLENALEIFKEYIKNHSLCDETQMRLFTLPNGEDFIREYIQKGYLLCDVAEVRFIELYMATINFIDIHNFGGMLKEYIKKHTFCNEAQLKIIDLPYSEDLIYEYLEQGYPLSKEAQVRMVDRQDAEALMKIYTRLHYLCDEAQLRLIESAEEE